MDSPSIVITGLYCYPVKSCRGIPLTTAVVVEMGIRYDRQWMVINERNVFVAQRGDAMLGASGIKTMCLIETGLTPQYLTLSAPGMEPLQLPLGGYDGEVKPVHIWDAVCGCIDQGDEAAHWLTEFLSREMPGRYRLVRMPDDGIRATELGNSKVAFADAYPFLLTSEESLGYLNSHLAVPLPMNRFRPNIVIKGGGPFAENTIGKFTINGIGFDGVKRDGRCSITTIDQMTAVAGVEPLRSFATLKQDGKYLFREGNGVYFGMYLAHSATGTISLGDRLIFK